MNKPIFSDRDLHRTACPTLDAWNPLAAQDRLTSTRRSDVVFARAGGDVVCEVCGKKYYDHPMDKEYLDYNGRPYLHIACDGRRLKL